MMKELSHLKYGSSFGQCLMLNSVSGVYFMSIELFVLHWSGQI